VGLLGMLNGMFGADDRTGMGPIRMELDEETGDIKGFHVG